MRINATGNLRYEKLPNNTVVREYRWDQQNRLVRVLEGTHESVYEYDGESHRVRIKELTSSVETKNETFVWCGSRICQKRSGSTVVRNYFRQGFEEGSTDYFYTGDHLGSVREVVGSDGITVASRRLYDPWGKGTVSGSGALADFGFTGYYLDRPTGESLTWWRAYDPSLGRWLTMDPIGLKGGANLYAYVGGNPVNLVDPFGQEAQECKLPPGPLPPQGPCSPMTCPCDPSHHNQKKCDCIQKCPAKPRCEQEADDLYNSCKQKPEAYPMDCKIKADKDFWDCMAGTCPIGCW